MELVIVLAVIVVLATMIYPSLDAMYADYRLTAATDMIRAAWASARARASDEGRPYRFAIVPNKGNFRIAPDDHNFWGGGDVPASDEGAPPPLIQEEALPKGVRFATPDMTANGPPVSPGGESALPAGSIEPSVWVGVVTFLPGGTAREDVEMTFFARGARPMTLRLRGLTGVVTMKTFGGEDGRR
jgi:hypothetical protein